MLAPGSDSFGDRGCEWAALGRGPSVSPGPPRRPARGCDSEARIIAADPHSPSAEPAFITDDALTPPRPVDPARAGEYPCGPPIPAGIPPPPGKPPAPMPPPPPPMPIPPPLMPMRAGCACREHTAGPRGFRVSGRPVGWDSDPPPGAKTGPARGDLGGLGRPEWWSDPRRPAPCPGLMAPPPRRLGSEKRRDGRRYSRRAPFTPFARGRTRPELSFKLVRVSANRLRRPAC